MATLYFAEVDLAEEKSAERDAIEAGVAFEISMPATDKTMAVGRVTSLVREKLENLLHHWGYGDEVIEREEKTIRRSKRTPLRETKPAEKIETIAEQVYNAEQSWYFERIVKAGCWGSTKLRVKIRRNAYDDQSFARVYLWTKTEWSLVAERPITDCECRRLSYTLRGGVSARDFENDYAALIATALAVIS